jgi:hypothetical protein
MQSNFINEKPLGYQQITSLATAQSLAVPAGTKLIMITPSGAAVRWRADGTAPTATVGYPLSAGVELRFTGTFASMQALQFIQQSASATLDIAYFANGEY